MPWRAASSAWQESWALPPSGTDLQVDIPFDPLEEARRIQRGQGGNLPGRRRFVRQPRIPRPARLRRSPGRAAGDCNSASFPDGSCAATAHPITALSAVSITDGCTDWSKRMSAHCKIAACQPANESPVRFQSFPATCEPETCFFAQCEAKKQYPASASRPEILRDFRLAQPLLQRVKNASKVLLRSERAVNRGARIP
jgi:hypothetical protein